MFFFDLLNNSLSIKGTEMQRILRVDAILNAYQQTFKLEFHQSSSQPEFSRSARRLVLCQWQTLLQVLEHTHKDFTTKKKNEKKNEKFHYS